MWRNPMHPAPASATEPPVESGQRLVALPRPRRDGPDEELRVTLDEFQGHPFLSCRVWTIDRDGNAYPTRKGCSIRLGEVDGVIGALREGQRLAGEKGPNGTVNRRAPGPSRRSDSRQAALPEVAAGGPEFDEFATG